MKAESLFTPSTWRFGISAFRRRHVSFLILGMLISSSIAFSQTSVQVITKIIEKEIPYAEGQPIRLSAQKADVIVKGWNRPTISVKLRLIAKHPNRAIAERELKYHQYSLQGSTDKVELSNRFVIPQQAGKLQSQLKAIYEVNLPTKALIILTNSFGDINLTNLEGNVTITFEFGKLTLDDIAGELSVKSDYGDIDGRNLNAQLTIKAEKADVSLRDLGGSTALESRYGKLTLQPMPSLNTLYVEADRTDILIAPKRIADFRFNVVVTSSDIRVPETLSELLTKQKNKQIFRYQPAGSKPEITIRNRYSPILIQSEKSLVDR